MKTIIQDQLSIYDEHGDDFSEPVNNLELLLKNNLTFGKCGPWIGRDSDGLHFLCGEIKDEDLPWDVDEVDF